MRNNPNQKLTRHLALNKKLPILIQVAFIRGLPNVDELFRAIKYKDRYHHLRDKVIFGVDWYLSLVTKAPVYKEYVESFYDTMHPIDRWQWYRSALANPATFYGFDEHATIDKMNVALARACVKQSKKTKEAYRQRYSRIKTIPETCANIRNQLAKMEEEVKK